MNNLALAFSCVCIYMMASQVCLGQSDTSTQKSYTTQEYQQSQKWLDDLYELGIRIEGDTVFVSDETRKVVADSVYRASIYRVKYDWAEANSFFDKKEYKIAFWYLINLYTDDPTSKQKVLKYILTFDQIFQMERLLTSAFYTYAFVDPQVAVITNGTPEVQHPEIIEDKQASLQEIIKYIQAYRLSQSE